MRRGPRSSILRSRHAFLVMGGAVTFAAGIAILALNLSPLWAGSQAATRQDTSLVISNPAPVGASGGSDSGAADGILGSGVSAPPPDGPSDGIAFKMTVPALGYSATVREGVTAGDLEQGPGHYPTTAWPGRAGTVCIAAHNVYWLAFANLHVGDTLTIQTRHVAVEYEITAIKITSPNDRTVLVPTSEHRLALTTCYPLWAGAWATQRFIFFGRQLDAVPG